MAPMVPSGSAPIRFEFTLGPSGFFGSLYRPYAKVYLQSAEGAWLPLGCS